jgi:hypothetical protein
MDYGICIGRANGLERFNASMEGSIGRRKTWHLTYPSVYKDADRRAFRA